MKRLAILVAVTIAAATAGSASAWRIPQGPIYPLALQPGTATWSLVPNAFLEEDDGVCAGHGGIESITSYWGGVTPEGIQQTILVVRCKDGHTETVVEDGGLAWFQPLPNAGYEEDSGDSGGGGDTTDWAACEEYWNGNGPWAPGC